MARIGNITSPGRYTIGAWREQHAVDAQRHLENKVITTERMTVVRCTYPAGSDFPTHFHPQEQITIVEAGSILFEIEGEKVEVVAGQMIAIPANVRHATRVGPEPACALNLFVLPEAVAARPQMLPA